MRKKWVTHMRPAEIAAATKTTRTVRCIVKDGKALLQYSHQVNMPPDACEGSCGYRCMLAACQPCCGRCLEQHLQTPSVILPSIA